MATASGGLSLSDEPVCPICMDTFYLPRQLPCMHAFCEKCLQNYISNKANEKGGVLEEFLCPVCRNFTHSPHMGRPVNKWASLFPQSALSLRVKSKVQLERVCDACQSEGVSISATGFCLDCKEGLCDACLGAHKKTKASKAHNIIGIEDIENNLLHAMQFAKGFGCSEHNEKNVEFHCKTHDVICCQECFFLHHRKCDKVADLKTDLSNLLDEVNPGITQTYLQEVEKHLNAFVSMRETSIHNLESNMTELTNQMRDIKNKINEILDKMEISLRIKATNIYKEEMIRTQEETHQCQSLINAVRNSRTFLETVLKCGTDLQKFVVTNKSNTQLQSYRSQIREKYEQIETVTLNMNVDAYMMQLLSRDGNEIAKLECVRDDKRLPCMLTPLRDRQIKVANVVDLICPSQQIANHKGVVQVPEGDLVLADISSNSCSLYDSSYMFQTSHALTSEPYDICQTDDHEVAIALPYEKKVQFLSFGDNAICDSGAINTKYKCFSVATLNKDELVVSGRLDKSDKCYWSLITRKGLVMYQKEIDSTSISTAYVAVNNSKSHVYMSVGATDSVYFFRLSDGHLILVYTSQALKNPLGLTVDRENNLYVVGYNSNNIHKISPDGTTLQIITSGVPDQPSRIYYNGTNDQLLVTNESPEARHKIHIFEL